MARARKQSFQLCPVALTPRVTRSGPNALVMAFIAALASGEGVQTWIMPPLLLVLLVVSYLTRPPSRRLIPGGPSVRAPDIA